MPDESDKKNRHHQSLKEKDHLLWEAAIRDVTPLTKENGAFVPFEPDIDSSGKTTEPVITRTRQRSGAGGSSQKKTGDTLEESQSPQPRGAGLDRRSNDRLRRGKMPIEAVLDLHGCHRTEAYEALKNFIYNSYSSGKRCVLVVTGKGQRSVGTGVIKRSFPDWIGDKDLSAYVLQYHAARPHHGGDGAFYVLLRRKREK